MTNRLDGRERGGGKQDPKGGSEDWNPNARFAG